MVASAAGRWWPHFRAALADLVCIGRTNALILQLGIGVLDLGAEELHAEIGPKEFE